MAAACVCATLHAHSAVTTAQLEDWLRWQRCSGASHVALVDLRGANERNAGIDGEAAFSWALAPWVESTFLTLLSPVERPSVSGRSSRSPPNAALSQQCVRDGTELIRSE